jgi:hypothetical protein
MDQAETLDRSLNALATELHALPIILRSQAARHLAALSGQTVATTLHVAPSLQQATPPHRMSSTAAASKLAVQKVKGKPHTTGGGDDWTRQAAHNMGGEGPRKPKAFPTTASPHAMTSSIADTRNRVPRGLILKRQGQPQMPSTIGGPTWTMPAMYRSSLISSRYDGAQLS